MSDQSPHCDGDALGLPTRSVASDDASDRLDEEREARETMEARLSHVAREVLDLAPAVISESKAAEIIGCTTETARSLARGDMPVEDALANADRMEELWIVRALAKAHEDATEALVAERASHEATLEQLRTVSQLNEIAGGVADRAIAAHQRADAAERRLEAANGLLRRLRTAEQRAIGVDLRVELLNEVDAHLRGEDDETPTLPATYGPLRADSLGHALGEVFGGPGGMPKIRRDDEGAK